MILKRGDVLEFKAGKLKSLSGLLAALLKRYNPDWTAWGWHLGVVYCRLYNDYLIIEAAPSGVRLVLLSELRGQISIHRLLPYEPRFYTMTNAVKKLNGERYDYIAYIWTALYIITGRRLPRVVNRRLTCWELVYRLYDLIGYPLALDYQYPVISDFEKLSKQRGAYINTITL